MSGFFKKYIGVIIAWVVVAIAAIFVTPNALDLVASHGQPELPKTAQSQVAKRIKNNWGSTVNNTRQVFIVFSNGNKKLNNIQKSQINETLNTLNAQKDQYDIKNIVKPDTTTADTTGAAAQQNQQSTAAPTNDHQSTAASTPNNQQTTAASSSASSAAGTSGAVGSSAAGTSQLTNSSPDVSATLNSKDGTTMLADLNVGYRDSTHKMDQLLKKGSRTAGVTTYITSATSLNGDYQSATKASLAKVEIIGSIVIFIVLVLLFRSLLIPLLSLVSTWIAYLISLALILNLVSQYHFPFSNFTQISLLVLLLGLGTDFSILLVNAFKQELRTGKDQLEATLAARKQAGKTILTLVVLFALLGFANFSVYQSLVGVAIGLVILTLVLLTFMPFFLYGFGERIFWPSTNLEAHNYSRSWGFLSKKSATYPLIALIIAIIVAIPFVMLNKSHLNYNGAAEITQKYETKKGYEVVNQHYPNGINAPVTIYIKADHGLRTSTDLEQIETITRQLRDQKGIAAVNSPTQPHGEPIKQLYVNQQMDTLTQDNDAVSQGIKSTAKKLQKTNISTASIDSVTGDAQSITGMVSTIRNEFNSSGIFATPEQMVNELQQKLRAAHRRQLTTMQRTVVTEALARTLNDQQQQTQMNSALSSIGLKTDSINSGTNAFKSELNNVQNQVRSYASTLGNLNNSLTTSNNFLKAFAKSSAANTLYIPDNVINAPYFKTLVKQYLSDDEKVAKIEVVLNATPGSQKSINLVRELEDQVHYDLNGSSLQNSILAVGGYSSEMADTQTAAKSGFKRVVLILGVAAALILMVVAGSILQPAYLMVSLGVTYLMSLGFTKLISGSFLGQKWLTWQTPFLVFVMLLALGVDYSLYLLMKYKQTSGEGKSATRMVNASILIGTVIIFAVVVIGIIFAALIPSGVLTLIQVAIAVIFGLVIFGIVVPSILPGLMRLTYEGLNFKELDFKHRKGSKQKE